MLMQSTCYNVSYDFKLVLKICLKEPSITICVIINQVSLRESKQLRRSHDVENKIEENSYISYQKSNDLVPRM